MNFKQRTAPPAKIDMQLLALATAYKRSTDARARNMMRGRAQRLINTSYTVGSNRTAVRQEWCSLADGKGWLGQ